MSQTTAQRVAAHRARMKAQGLTTLSLTVPAADAAHFRRMAQQSRVAAAAHDRSDEPGGRLPDDLPHTPPMLSNHQRRLAQRWSAQSGPRSTQTIDEMKLSALLARHMTHEIASAGWPRGRTLGSEQELMARYEVGRHTLRDAINLLEFQGVAVVKRGPGGGLVVSEPTMSRAAYACGVFLQSHSYDQTDLHDSRLTIELAVLARCAARLDDEARAALKALLVFESTLDSTATGSDLQRYHRELARLCGDAALKLFANVLLQASRFRSRYDQLPAASRRPIVEQLRRDHARITRELFLGQTQRAGDAMRHHLRRIAKWSMAPR